MDCNLVVYLQKCKNRNANDKLNQVKLLLDLASVAVFASGQLSSVKHVILHSSTVCSDQCLDGKIFAELEGAVTIVLLH